MKILVVVTTLSAFLVFSLLLLVVRFFVQALGGRYREQSSKPGLVVPTARVCFFRLGVLLEFTCERPPESGSCSYVGEAPPRSSDVVCRIKR